MIKFYSSSNTKDKFHSSTEFQGNIQSWGLENFKGRRVGFNEICNRKCHAIVDHSKSKSSTRMSVGKAR